MKWLFNFIKKPVNNRMFSSLIENGTVVNIGENVRFRNFNTIIVKNKGVLNIGNNCFFNSYTSINCLGKIEIGNDTIFGEGVRIYDHNHKYDLINGVRNFEKYSIESVSIGNNCWIGSNVIILKGVNIGNNVVIGAGCLIYKSIPDNSIVKLRQELIII